MNKLTEYLDIPLTQALVESFGAKLERLAAIDKLDAAQAILTAIAWGDIEQIRFDCGGWVMKDKGLGGWGLG